MAGSAGILDVHEDEVNRMVRSSPSVITLTDRVKPYSPAGSSAVVLSSDL